MTEQQAFTKMWPMSIMVTLAVLALCVKNISCDYENTWNFYNEQPCCGGSDNANYATKHRRDHVREFNCGKLYYRTFHMDEERDSLYVGAMDRIFRLSLKNISSSTCDRDLINLEPTRDDVVSCVSKGKSQMPTNEDEWKDIANEFENQWNFINCIGAIDGKHVHIKKPKTSGSYYFNYKKTFSIVLLAVVNANYEFICVEVGANGRASDAGVFAQSEYKRRYDEQSLRIPKPRQIKNASYELPYVLVGDDAFPLSSNLMKPYSRQKLEKEHLIFNYRLSRARRIVENAFGIISSRFRILLNTISLQPEKASVIVLCCCYLHNYLSKENARVYLRGAADPDKMSDQQMDDLKPLKGSNYTDDAKEIREHFREYFNTIGAVPWQNDRI